MAVLATAVWRVRPSGSNTNGGGYDPGIAGAATDYSQQNAAQVTGTTGTSTASTTFTDAGGAFTSAMIGNALWLASATGTPTVGAYFITAVGGATSVTLDRASGTYTAANYAVGGGWADFWTNVAPVTWVVQGNVVYVLGSGTPNPSSYTYDYTISSATTLLQRGGSSGQAIIANDPLTPGYKAPVDTTGGMPTVQCNTSGTDFTIRFFNVNGLWFVAGSGKSAGNTMVNLSGNSTCLYGCVFDQFGLDVLVMVGNQYSTLLGSEVFSSVSAGAGTRNAVTNLAYIANCNIHDTIGHGVYFSVASTMTIINSIVAKCGARGIVMDGGSGGANVVIASNTIDGNKSDGIYNTSISQLYMIYSNIISNHTTAGKFGINDPTGNMELNGFAPSGGVIDYNVFYNNTANLTTNLTYGSHDTHGGSNPYVGQATENYALA